jgi:hypothetical protein
MRPLTTALTVLALAILPAHSGQAQPKCPEGRTISGECVDPVLTDMNTLRVIAFTQPKISFTSPPFLPNDDRVYRVPPTFHEVNAFAFPPTQTPGFFVSVFQNDVGKPVVQFVPIGPRP